MQTPFTKRRLEEASTLVADRYNVSTRTARKYVGAYADATFRLRGRRLPIGGKGSPLMFSLEDWQIYQAIHEGGAVNGPADVPAAVGAYYKEIERLSGEGAGVEELIAEVRADVRRVAQHVMGDERMTESRTEPEGTTDARLERMLALIEEQQRTLASQGKVIETLGVKLAEVTAQVEYLGKGVGILVDAALND